MAHLLSDDEDAGPSSSKVRVGRRSKATDTSMFGSELPSFDTNFQQSNPNTSFSNARLDQSMNATVDLDDEELYGEGEETKVRELMRRWLDERLAPDLLPWNGELVAEILEMLQSQVCTCLASRFDSPRAFSE
jgi:hypothetical protein